MCVLPRSWVRQWVALSLVLFTRLTVLCPETFGAPHAYLVELTNMASQAKLSEQRVWHLLLHYQENLLGGYTSEVDDPGFFLSPNGRTNPETELQATLQHFFSDTLVGRSRQPAQCVFVARYRWLKEQLGFDDQKLPPRPCERFDRWYEELNPQSVTLVFPSAYLNNPASMFGHTFLRIDRKGQTEQTRILAYTINFAADVPEGEGALYPVRGIFGAYQGYFSTIPYYMQIKEYGDIENRDMWEFPLNFTEDQIRWMLMHVWELGNGYFDYYFFKENCSYHLLSLLEVADPDLSLRAQFVVWTVPADTIRLLTEYPELVGEIIYRPARSTKIRRLRDRLSAVEREWVGAVTDDPIVERSEGFSKLSVHRQAFILDMASDYLQFQGMRDESNADLYRDRNQKVLLARSRRRIPSPQVSFEPETSPPSQGHGTSRVGLGVGWRGGEVFEEVTLRAGYHDLLDPDPGYTPDAQIELLDVRLRHYEKREQFRVERVTLANIVSLSPMDALFHTPSWKFKGGFQTIKRDRCGLCSNWNFNGGIGAALEGDLLGRTVLFTFAEMDANAGEAYEEGHRIGGGLTAGVVANLGERWKVMASGSYLAFLLGDPSDDGRAFAGLRYTLGQHGALRFEFNHRDQDDQGVFSVQAFF